MKVGKQLERMKRRVNELEAEVRRLSEEKESANRERLMGWIGLVADVISIIAAIVTIVSILSQ